MSPTEPTGTQRWVAGENKSLILTLPGMASERVRNVWWKVTDPAQTPLRGGAQLWFVPTYERTNPDLKITLVGRFNDATPTNVTYQVHVLVQFCSGRESMYDFRVELLPAAL